jgi:hypothetical protein
VLEAVGWLLWTAAVGAVGAITGPREKSCGPSSVEGTSEEADGGRPWIFSMVAGVHSSLEVAAELESGGVGAPAPVVRSKAADTGVVPSTAAKAMDLRAVDDMGRTGGGGQSGSCDTRMREASSMLRPCGCQQIFARSEPSTGGAEAAVVCTNDPPAAVRGGRCGVGAALGRASAWPEKRGLKYQLKRNFEEKTNRWMTTLDSGGLWRFK